MCFFGGCYVPRTEIFIFQLVGDEMTRTCFFLIEFVIAYYENNRMQGRTRSGDAAESMNEWLNLIKRQTNRLRVIDTSNFGLLLSSTRSLK